MNGHSLSAFLYTEGKLGKHAQSPIRGMTVKAGEKGRETYVKSPGSIPPSPQDCYLHKRGTGLWFRVESPAGEWVLVMPKVSVT